MNMRPQVPGDTEASCVRRRHRSGTKDIFTGIYILRIYIYFFIGLYRISPYNYAVPYIPLSTRYQTPPAKRIFWDWLLRDGH